MLARNCEADGGMLSAANGEAGGTGKTICSEHHMRLW